MKIYLDMIGCRLNQAEIEQYGRRFRALGYELVPFPEQADLAVVNTCTVTRAAASDSRAKTRQIQRAGTQQIALTGCWSTLNPQAAAGLPGVTQIIPNRRKDSLVSELLNKPENSFDLEPVEREPIPGARLRTRAFIKVQDGCSNQCTFCITTIARGRNRSRPIREIIADITGVTAGGAREVVLTGVHLGSWGSDYMPAKKLSHLVREILASTDIPRLRLSSLEPWDLDEDFFHLWEEPRLCRQLHLPLQSGSASVLKRMRRNITPISFAQLVDKAKQVVPDMAVTTDIICGFPGESEAEFSESLDFVRGMHFAGGHVFTYSSRPGTPAARLPDQVPHSVRKARNARVREVLEESRLVYQRQFIGCSLPVLWESASSRDKNGWKASGLTDNYLRVHAYTPENLWNQITQVKLLRVAERGLVGEIL